MGFLFKWTILKFLKNTLHFKTFSLFLYVKFVHLIGFPCILLDSTEAQCWIVLPLF